MNWELLTSPEFEKSVKKCRGVCLLPAGVIEKHGSHLPLGQDALYIHAACTRAAEKEPVMVFPFLYFGQILEARHVPGTVALKSKLLLDLFENVCDEICRNGFTKIIIANGHGGNTGFLRFFCDSLLEKEKPYMVFVSQPWYTDKNIDKLRKSKLDGHGGERETSTMLHLRPELVKMREYGSYGMPLKRLKRFEDAELETPVWWYADYPGHFKGDHVQGTAKFGKLLVESHANHLAKQIRLVKQDDTPFKLYREFQARAVKPANRKHG